MSNENLHRAACNVDLLSAPETIETLKLMTRFDNATKKIMGHNRRARIRLLLERHEHDPAKTLASMTRAVERAESVAAELPAAGQRAEADAVAVRDATDRVSTDLRRQKTNFEQERVACRQKAKALEMKRRANVKTLVDAGLVQDDAETAAKPSPAEIADLLARADEALPARIAAIDEALSDHVGLVAAAAEAAAA